MNYNTYIIDTVALQNKFNSSIDSKWLERKDFKWDLCIFVEVGEMLASTGYKHWKNEKLDLENIKMEIVDIYHFWLSWALFQLNKYNIQGMKNDLREIMIQEMKQYYDNKFLNYNPLILQTEKKQLYKEHFIKELKEKSFKLTSFLINQESKTTTELIRDSFYSLLELIHICFENFEDFYALYLAKNALNKFRQDNGYKTGNYKKIWHGNMEDNYHVSKIIDDIKKLTNYNDLLNIDYILIKMAEEYQK